MKKIDKYQSSPCEASCKHLQLHSNCNDVVNSANKATRDNNIYAFTSTDEEDIMTSLELFLKEPQDQASNSFVTSLSRDYNKDNNIGRDYINDVVITKDETNYGTNQISPQACSNKVMKAVDDHFDDFYGELGMLPEVNRYKYYDYLALFDPMVNEKS